MEERRRQRIPTRGYSRKAVKVEARRIVAEELDDAVGFVADAGEISALMAAGAMPPAARVAQAPPSDPELLAPRPTSPDRPTELSMPAASPEGQFVGVLQGLWRRMRAWLER